MVAERTWVHIRKFTFISRQLIGLAVLIVGFRELRSQNSEIAR